MIVRTEKLKKGVTPSELPFFFSHQTNIPSTVLVIFGEQKSNDNHTGTKQQDGGTSMAQNRIRKGIIFMLIFALIGTMFTASVFAADSPIKLIVNGKEIVPDVPPQTIDGRTMVPVRFVSEALGATVDWNADKQAVLVNSTADQAGPKGNQIQLIVNGKAVQPDVPPVTVDGRTLVPVRWVAEALGAVVDWNADTRTVTITGNLGSGGGSSSGVTVIPSIKYPGESVTVADDELLVIIEGSRTFELPGMVDKLFTSKVKERFPDKKITFLTWDKPLRWEDFDALGIAPDVVITLSRTNIDATLEKRDWAFDMTDLINQYGIDLSKMNQGAVEMIKSRSDGGMYGVPLFINEYVLYYNINIFDGFGVDYPKLGMTYDEAYELAQKVTGQVGVVNYKGYTQHPDQYLDFNQLGLLPFDPTDTEEPTAEQILASINLLSNENWMYLVDNIYRFLAIPGNVYNSAHDDFFRNNKAAMAVETIDAIPYYLLIDDYIDSEQDREFYEQWTKNLKFGVSSVPVLDKAPNTIYQPNLYGYHITKQSNKKDLAMEVLVYLVSEEFQKHLSAHGWKSIYNTEEMKEAFGTAYPEYANVPGLKEAVYWGENAKVQNYQNTEWVPGFPLHLVFRQYVLKEGNTGDAALQNAANVGIPTWYYWNQYDEEHLRPIGK